MAEGFDPYHVVPLQRRRADMVPIYDPSSLFSSDFTGGSAAGAVKEEGGGYLGYHPGGGGNLMYMIDPRSSSSSSINLNPSTSIQEMEPNPFLYNHPQSFKLLNHGSSGQVSNNACNHGLSLSLSSHQNYDHTGKMGSSSSSCFVPAVVVNDLSRNSVPSGPFTGYASVLKGSRFLGPAQQLLEEICDVGEGNYPQKLSSADDMLDPSMENIAKNFLHEDSSSQQSCDLGTDQGRNKSKLMLLLNEVYKRYKQYCHQMQTVVASFESVSGVKNAAPFASIAVKAMSKHFKFLRNVISDQLQRFLSEPPHNNTSHNNVITQQKDIPLPTYDTTSAPGMFDFVQHQPVWRPQRGLPERAVTVLRSWLFDHFLHPYPTDTDKLMLAKQTGLSRNQVSNWFINARVRLWKPMVEEIHMLETRQAQKSSHEEVVVSNADLQQENNIVSCVKTSTQRIQDNNNIMSLKRARRNESTPLLMDTNLSAYPQMGLGVSSGSANGGGVSLTLGLQQNNTRLGDPFSVSAARRLGLVDPNGEEYVAGGGWNH